MTQSNVSDSNGKQVSQLIKVTRVDSNGGIVSIETINFGNGYKSDFYLTHSSSQLPRTAAARIKKLTVSGSRISVTKDDVNQYSIPNDSFIERYQDYGYILKPDYYVIPYGDVSYAGTLLEQFYQEIKTLLEEEIDFALIRFNIGPIAKYPGHYISNDGFLDDDIYLQDSYKYQKYSYVVKVDESLDKYKLLVKSYLHPAGTGLFADYQIQTVYDRAKSVVVNSSQKLGQWRSRSTVNQINRSIPREFAYPQDLGGKIRIDPYDENYMNPFENYNPPLSYRFGPSNELYEDIYVIDSLLYNGQSINVKYASISDATVSGINWISSDGVDNGNNTGWIFV
jgi:hypothetical protein